MGYAPPFEIWAPVWEILDPSLLVTAINKKTYMEYSIVIPRSAMGLVLQYPGRKTSFVSSVTVIID